MKKWRLKIGLYSAIALVFCLCSSLVIHAAGTLPPLKENNVTFDAIVPLSDGEHALMILKHRDPVGQRNSTLMIVKMNLVTFEKELLLSTEKDNAWFDSKIVQNETGFLITIHTQTENSLIDVENYVYSEVDGTLAETLFLQGVKDSYTSQSSREYLKLEDDTLTIYEVANTSEVEINHYKDPMFSGLKMIPYLSVRAKLEFDNPNQGYKETILTVGGAEYSLCKGEILSEDEASQNCQLSTEEVQRELAESEYSRKIAKMYNTESIETIILSTGNQPLGLLREKGDSRVPKYLVTTRDGQDIKIPLPILAAGEEASSYTFRKEFAIGSDAVYLSTDKTIVKVDLVKEEANVIFTEVQLKTAFFEEKVISDENEDSINEVAETSTKSGIDELFKNIKSEIGRFFRRSATVRMMIIITTAAFFFLLANRLKRIKRKSRSRQAAYQTFDTEQNSANKNVDKQIAKMRRSTQSEKEQAIKENKIRKDSSTTDHQSNKEQDKQNQKLKSEYDKEIEKFNRKFGGSWDK